MKEEKKTGSYYTPLELIQFMVDYLEKRSRTSQMSWNLLLGMEGSFLCYYQRQHILRQSNFLKKKWSRYSKDILIVKSK